MANDEVTITFSMDSASFFDSPESELEATLEKASRLVLDTLCGPNGFTRTLMDSNGNTIGKVTVK